MSSTWEYGHMPLSQRAKIFAPFAALKGFEDLIRQQEETYEEMPELSDDQYEDLNFAMNSIRTGDYVTVRYFRDFHIRTLSGLVERIAIQKKAIRINAEQIGFDEMIEITF